MFLKSIFSRKKVEKPTMELKLEELEEWVRKENSDFTVSLESEIKKFYVRLEEKISDLGKNFYQFRESQVNPEALEKLRRAAQTNKLIIEKSVANFIESISLPMEASFSVAKSFSEFLAQKIEELGKKNRRCFFIVREALGESTRNLMYSIGELEKENLEMLKMLKERESRIGDVEESVELAKNIKADIERGPVLEKEIHNLESGIDYQTQKMDTARREASNLGSGREMQRLKEMEDELKELEKKKKEVDERLASEMSNFEKALKKIGHDKHKLVATYLENPLEALKEKDGLKKFKSLLPLVKESVDKGELSGKVKEKALLGLERAESGVLDWVLKEKIELDSRTDEHKKKMEKNSAVHEKREKEKEAEDWNQTILKTRKRIQDLKREKDSVAKKIENEKKELEKRLKSLSEREVKVTF